MIFRFKNSNERYAVEATDSRNNSKWLWSGSFYYASFCLAQKEAEQCNRVYRKPSPHYSYEAKKITI